MGKERDTIGERLKEMVATPLREIGVELSQKWDQGRTELAAGLLRGHDAFVLYPKTPEQEADKQKHQPLHGPEPDKEQERGGREM